jgi:hypothetical protein
MDSIYERKSYYTFTYLELEKIITNIFSIIYNILVIDKIRSRK